jgi:hypothetical protein
MERITEMSNRLFGLVLGLGLVATATSAHASMCVEAKTVKISKDECMKRGMTLVGKYYKTVNPQSATIFGHRGEYTGAVYCDAAKDGVVFFVSTGPQGKVCSRDVNSLVKDF